MRLVEFKIISVFSKQTTVIFTLSQKNIGLVTSITLNELHPIKFLVVQGVLMPLVGAVGLAGNVLSVAVPNIWRVFFYPIDRLGILGNAGYSSRILDSMSYCRPHY